MKDLAPEDEDNVFAALEQRDRVRHINLWVTYAALDNMVTLMQEPFPELRRLAISSRCQNMPILPDDFLGGSAPCLREILFCSIPFPALPTLLSSASDLVQLILVDIPQTGHISSAAFAACLAVLPSLEHLSIEFRSPGPPTDQHLPPKTRAVLPSLTSFIFEGESAYLEVFLAQVDTPQLDWINIRYTNDLDFRVTEFPKFIERSVLKPSRFGHAEIFFGGHVIWFYFFHQTDSPTIAIRFFLDDHSSGLIFDMARLLNQTSAMLSEVVRLEIRIDSSTPYWRDDIGGGLSDGTEWLELFRPFKAVKKLHICEELAESITHALDGRIEAGTRVLPALKSICVEELTDLRERGRLLSNGDDGLDSDDSE